jgi:hypothetical protein
MGSRGTPRKDIAVGTRLKVNQVRFGPNKLFDHPDDRGAGRQNLGEDGCVRRFDDVWQSALRQAVEEAGEIAAEDARQELNDKQRKFFDPTQSHREFWLAGMKFIAQLHGPELTQLWGIRSSDHNPRALWVEFGTKDDGEAFGRIAEALGWPAEDLSLKILRDFVESTAAVLKKPHD